MNRQKIFEKVARHMLTKKVPLPRPVHGKRLFRVAYRDEYGNTCPIGSLILPQYYNPIIEGKSVMSVQVQYMLMKSLGPMNPGDMELIFMLQLAHERSDRWSKEELRIELIDIGQKYNLDVSFLNKLQKVA